MAIFLVGIGMTSSLGLSRASSGSAGLVALVAAWYGLHEVGVVRSVVPQRRAQVPHGWRFKRAAVAQFQYGFILGAGVFTYVRISTLVVVAAWVAIRAEVTAAALVMAAFGVARSTAAVAVATTRAAWRDSGLVVEILRPLAPAVHKMNGAALLLCSAWILINWIPRAT